VIEAHAFTTPRRVSARAIVRGGICAAVVVVAAEVVGQLVDFGAYNLRISLLNSSTDHSVFSRLSSLALLLAAAGAFAAGRTYRRRGAMLASAVLGLLFVDSLTDLHSTIPGLEALEVLLLVTAAVALASFARVLDRPQAVLVWTGLGLLALSLAVHVLGPHIVAWLGWGPDSWAYQAKIAVKAGTELAGWAILATGLLSALAAAPRARRPRAA
jgi:hypothetical protein